MRGSFKFLLVMPRFRDDNFQTLREKRSPKVNRGSILGKDGGLRLLVDAEVCIHFSVYRCDFYK